MSSDGRRMTGTMNNAMGVLVDYPVALQRVQPEANWLDRPSGTQTSLPDAGYELALIPAASSGTEFVAGRTYKLFHRQRTMSGDLGSFWSNEISAVNEGSPLRVGPVPATSPELPTELEVDFNDTGVTGVTATTASGGVYRFSASRMTAP